MSDADTPTEPEPWRDPRVGDRIRVVRVPTGHMQENTLALYRHLMQAGVVLTISRIGDPDLPWIEYRWKQEDGEDHHHYLAMICDSWERVDELG